MKKGVLTLLCSLLLLPLYAQRYEYVYRNANDSTVNCYLKYIPAGNKARGLLIRDYSMLPDTNSPSRFRLHELAVKEGFLVLYTVTSKLFPELYYDDLGPALLDEIVHEVMQTHQIPVHQLYIGGISASGTRGLRYAQYCLEGKSRYKHLIKAVFMVDSPLDLERFYLSAARHRHYMKAGMRWEADHMLLEFPKHLGGSAETHRDAYIKASVYTQSDSSGGNANLFRELPMLIYHEPDLSWWMEERGCSYYDINSYDIAGFVNHLRYLGNNKITLITTSGKGYDAAGKRNCHSWAIVDESYLMQWILQQAGY